jgi:hypothetical protein
MFRKMLFRRKNHQAIKGQAGRSPEDLEKARQRLRGKPLRPRIVWLLGPAAYVFACAVGLYAVLTFTDGVWLGIGLTVVAFFAGHIPELFVVFKYGKYREEWELANSPESLSDGMVIESGPEAPRAG